MMSRYVDINITSLPFLAYAVSIILLHERPTPSHLALPLRHNTRLCCNYKVEHEHATMKLGVPS